MCALVLGIDGAGKTSALARLCGEEVRTVMPTRGFTIRTLKIEGEAQLKLWDVSGKRELRTYWPEYFGVAQGLVYVIDASDWRRMQESSAELQRLLDRRELLGVPLLVIANKQDLPGALGANEVEACLHLGAIRDRPWHCVACSALRKTGLAHGLQWLVELHFADAERSEGARGARELPRVVTRSRAQPRARRNLDAGSQSNESDESD